MGTAGKPQGNRAQREPQGKRPAGAQGRGESYVRHAKASSAELTKGNGTRRGLFGLACLCVLGLTAFLGGGTPSAGAAADPCPNAEFRVGASANLPDCRAYELVTPENTGGVPIGPINRSAGMTAGPFDQSLASLFEGRPSVVYVTDSGSLPGFEGTGVADRYQSLRDPKKGWISGLIGPTAGQTEEADPSGISSDHSHSFFLTPDRGGTAVGTLVEQTTHWLRYPDGSFIPLGLGEIESFPGSGEISIDPDPCGRYISPGGSHIIFETGFISCLSPGSSQPGIPGSPIQLLSDAPPNGVRAIYDRTPSGLHTVSLLPGEITPMLSDLNATYLDASTDGSVVLFTLGTDSSFSAQGTLYARVDNEDTLRIASGSDGLPLGGTLTCTAGPSSAATKAFQWLRNGVIIPGATSNTYKASASDAGKAIQCQVFALNANAGATAVSTHVVVTPSPETAPPIASSIFAPLPESPEAGTEETCDPNESEWTGSPTFTYQWYVNGAAIPGATSSTYTVQAGDVPGVIQCAVTGANAGGSVTGISSNRLTSGDLGSPEPPEAFATTSDARITPAGVSADGGKVFYVQAGIVFSYDTATQSTTVVTDSGDAKLVNISADAAHVYFVSNLQLDGIEGTAGQPNLYVWDEPTESVDFIATVASGDLVGTPCLTCWTSQAVAPRKRPNTGPGKNASRVTPNGSVLVFESLAQLTGYENEGRNEIYRYDTSDESITCVSCHPGDLPPTSDASLQTVEPGRAEPVRAIFAVANLTADGNRVFFQTSDALVGKDTSGTQDIYEWEANGVGSCTEADGCISLLSSGQSPFVKDPFSSAGLPTNRLYAVSPDGQDVFILVKEQLLPQDHSGNSGAIYDVRVNGGFPIPDAEKEECQGDACQGESSGAPNLSGAASAAFAGAGNVKPRPKPRCGKGKRKVRRGGKTRCLKRHHKRHSGRAANTNRGGRS
jgi:hypothetical protein